MIKGCDGKSIFCGMHDFKTNIARYIRMLDRNEYDNVVLHARNKPIGIFVSFEGNRIRREKAALDKENAGKDEK